LVIAGKSKPHVHKKSTEIYEPVRGKLVIYKNGKKFILHEDEKIVIEPNIIHYVEGNETWFLTYSKSGWTMEDHVLVE